MRNYANPNRQDNGGAPKRVRTNPDNGRWAVRRGDGTYNVYVVHPYYGQQVVSSGVEYEYAVAVVNGSRDR